MCPDLCICMGVIPGRGASRTSLTYAFSQFPRLVQGCAHRPAAGVAVVGAELEGSHGGLPGAAVPPGIYALRILASAAHITVRPYLRGQAPDEN